MAIRTKKYQYTDGCTGDMRAVQITEKNLSEVVAYICRNGGAATGHNGDTASKRPARIRLKQRNFGKNWGKRDWRVARLGDWIVRHNFPKKDFAEIGNEPSEFERVPGNRFSDFFEEVK